MLSDIFSMLKKLIAAMKVFVYDPIFLDMAAIHVWRTNWKDYFTTSIIC